MQSSKRIVAGATGLIGTRLVNHWIAKGITVTAIGRSKEKIQSIFNNRVHPIEWQELQPELLRQAEVVVNLTGAGIADKRWTKARKNEILRSRTDSAHQLVSLLLTLGNDAPPLFNASAIGIYGLQEQNATGLPSRMDEDTIIDWNHSPDFLSYVGREWEKATHLTNQKNIRIVNLRFGVVLAKQGGALPKMVKPFYFYLGGKIGTGHQPFSWIAIDDVISAIDFLLEHPHLSGPVNIVSPGCVTQKNLAHAIGDVLHKPAFIPTPGFLLKLIFGDMAKELLLEGQFVYPKLLLDNGFQFSFPDIHSALQHVLR